MHLLHYHNAKLTPILAHFKRFEHHLLCNVKLVVVCLQIIPEK